MIWFKQCRSLDFPSFLFHFHFYHNIVPVQIGVLIALAGKVVAKFCAKHLHTQVLKYETCMGGDLAASVQKAFFR